MNTKVVLFTDLDGTLLGEEYNVTDIEPIISSLKECRVSIVLNSSKTRAEIEIYRKLLGLGQEPFIVENGSAVFIPKDFFRRINYNYTKQVGNYNVIELGTNYTTLRNLLATISNKTKSVLVGFGDMTVEEVAADCGLPVEMAKLAKMREYDEPFKLLVGSESDVASSIEALGLQYTKGGRYYHLLGCTDKGKAIEVLKGLYRQEFQKTVTMAVGDGENDIPMLKAVDKAFMIDSPKHRFRVWEEIFSAAKTCCSPN